jgi:hypothetical protein
MLADILHKVAEFDAEENYAYFPRPSLAGTERCIRSLDYYAQEYDRKPFPGRFITVLDDSSWHEQLILDWIRKSAFQVHSEQMKVRCGQVNGQNVNGKIDGIFTDILSIDRLLEVKAISHFGFQDIWNGHLPLDYITQSFLYLKGLKEVNPEINQGLLFIKNKNQAQYLEILLQYDLVDADTGLIIEMILSTGEKKEINEVIERVTQLAIERFEEIEVYRKEKKLHDRPYQKDHWRCEYCNYGELCWEGWEEEFERRDVDTILDEDVVDLCRYYLETNLHISEMEKEKDKLKEKIKKILKENNSRKALAGDYIITTRLQSKKQIDQTLIPPQILEKATKLNNYEVLSITKRKESKK